MRTNDNPAYVGDFPARNGELRVYCAADGSIEVTTPASNGRRTVDLSNPHELNDDELDDLVPFLAERCPRAVRLRVLRVLSSELGGLLPGSSTGWDALTQIGSVVEQVRLRCSLPGVR